MLNPDQAGRLRALIRSGADVSSFEGVRIERREIMLRDDHGGVETVLTEASGASTMAPPARLFGPVPPASLKLKNRLGAGHTPPVADKMLFKLRDATLIGHQALLGRFGLAAPQPIMPGEDAAGFQLDNEQNGHGFVLEAGSDPRQVTCYHACGESKGFHAGRALFFHTIEPQSYGAFLCRVLPQMLFVAAHGGLAFEFYIAPARTPWFMEAIRLLGLPERPVFSVAEILGDRIETVIVCSDFANGGWLDEPTAERLSAFVARTQAVAPDTPYHIGQRLYVSRGLHRQPPRAPRLTNEDAVMRMVFAHGFDVIYPETMTFARQISAFGAARVMLGPSGSGMLNAMFARSGCRVLEMGSSHPNTHPQARVYASSQKTYAFLFGSKLTQDAGPAPCDWEVDLADVREGIAWLEDDWRTVRQKALLF